jgi:hypothetical protein
MEPRSGGGQVAKLGSHALVTGSERLKKWPRSRPQVFGVSFQDTGLRKKEKVLEIYMAMMSPSCFSRFSSVINTIGQLLVQMAHHYGLLREIKNPRRRRHTGAYFEQISPVKSYQNFEVCALMQLRSFLPYLDRIPSHQLIHIFISQTLNFQFFEAKIIQLIVWSILSQNIFKYWRTSRPAASVNGKSDH